MKKIMRALSVLSIIGLSIFLVNYIRTHNMGVLNPKGVIAVAEKDLLITSVLLMMIVIVPVFVMFRLSQFAKTELLKQRELHLS